MDKQSIFKISNTIAVLKEKIKCAICLDLVADSTQLNCNHIFCKNCITRHRSHKYSSCPLCKKPLKRRINYKDHFGDELSKFVKQVCGLIKEKYGYQVEEVSKRGNIQYSPNIEYLGNEINISHEGSSQVHTENNLDIIKPTLDGCSILHHKPVKCYRNKRKQTNNQAPQKKLLEFQNSETRNRIIEWLNCTQKKYDIINQTENAKASMEEIGEENVSSRVRSQSLNLDENNFPLKLVNRYHSLNEGLHEVDDYNIEEIESEKMLQQVERKVVLDMLEEDCLDNLEKLAKKNVPLQKKTPKKGKKSALSCESSGWDRIKVVNRTINKACKIPKKLDISLQTSQMNEHRKLPEKENSKLKKKVSKHKIQEENKENEIRPRKVTDCCHHKQEPQIPNPSYNLSVVEKYFLQNINTIDIVDENTISGSSPDLYKTQLPGGSGNTEKEQEKCIPEEDIFSLSTQKTLSNQKHKEMFCVVPVNNNFGKIEGIVASLSNILEYCVAESKSLDGDMSLYLINCFSNIKSYVDKIKTLTVTTDNKETQTYQNLCPGITQTDSLSFQSREVEVSFNNMLPQSAQENNIIQQDNKASLPNNPISEVAEQLNTNEPIQNCQQSVLVCSIPTGLENKIKRKLAFSDNSQNNRFKRIRQPSSNSDSDNESASHKGYNRFIREDLTVQFIETETESHNHIQKEKDGSQNSNDILNDNYLEEIMRKYGDSPPKQDKSNNSTKFEIKKVPNVLSQEQDNSHKWSDSKIQKSQKSAISGQIFTTSSTFQKNSTKFDQEIEEAEKNYKEFSSEYDIIEDTPVEPKNKKPKLQLSKNADVKRSLPQQPLEIISKGSAKSSNKATNLKLNSVASSTEREITEMLENLQNNKEFFEDMECVTQNKLEQISNTLSQNPKTNCEYTEIQNKNIEPIARPLNNFDEDDQIEAELERICISAEQKNVEEREKSKVKILQHIVIRNNDIISDSNSDHSDEELVENTPEEIKISSSPHGFFFNSLENIASLSPTKNSLDNLCLPPPPGFGDEPKLERIHGTINENLELTPGRLTDFIVTPQTYLSCREEKSQNCSQISNLSFIIATTTPKLHKKMQHSTPSSQAKYVETLNFSPINKASTQHSQVTPIFRKTPLVTASKPATKTQNLMTSTPNQKSILNYVKSSQESANIWHKAKPCIIWTRIVNKDLHVFKELEIKKLVTVSNAFGPTTTHLVVVVDENGRLKSHTAKFLLAVAAGLWVVRYEWAQDCLKYNRIVPEEPYEALDLSGVPGPKISRTTRLTDPLFKGFRFCCAPPFSIVSRTEIENALKTLGAEIVKHPKDIRKNDNCVVIILTDTTATEEINQFESFLEDYKTVTVDVEWLTKCIGQYKIVSFRPYLLCSDELICDLGYPSALIESVPFTLTEATLGN